MLIMGFIGDNWLLIYYGILIDYLHSLWVKGQKPTKQNKNKQKNVFYLSWNFSADFMLLSYKSCFIALKTRNIY